MDEDWVKEIRNQCLSAKVPFFFKQWGGVQKKKAGRELEGRTWDEMPVKISLASAMISYERFCERITNSSPHCYLSIHKVMVASSLGRSTFTQAVCYFQMEREKIGIE